MDPHPEPDLAGLELAEDLYAAWLRDPASVPPGWARHFESLPGARDAPPPRRAPSFRPPTLFAGGLRPADARPCPGCDTAGRQERVDMLIRAFRVRGHMEARLDPLGLPRPAQPELDPAFYGFDDRDLGRTFSARTIFPHETLTLRGILEHMRNTYCRSIGAQFMHIDDLDLKQWLLERMEGCENRLDLGRDEQLRILTRLTDAVIFEEFVQRKYPGAKSFSLEGAESLIPLLDLAIEKAGDQGIEAVVVGMPHRGRLNVLAHVFGKDPRRIFREFDDRAAIEPGHGDVKYHLGHSTTWTTAAGRDLHLSLCFNPSHLELVDPVALGRVRAIQDRYGDARRERTLGLLIHGDAAFAGEGILQETLNLSQLAGYATGGTLHVVVNNQIGFTTGPEEGRSTPYATDVARMLQVPIFHVNGEDPEAVAQVIRLAMDFRAQYRRDVVIDMYAYRRRGHNEGDEPAFTQPVMYKAIAARPSVREGYLDHLVRLGKVSRGEAEAIAVARRERFEAELAAARSGPPEPRPGRKGVWAGYEGGPDDAVPEPATGVDRSTLARLLDGLARFPDGFRPHPKLVRILERRAAMARGDEPLDWAAAEALAFATLAAEGRRVRLTGQDAQRGTFSHRHAVLHDAEDGRTYMPLGRLGPDAAPVEIVNSPLSETAVLGFEYGYSLDAPGALVAWEAQFGDFANVAQPVIDQFLAAAEAKWRRLSGLALLLPHGLEGQGPEHSSARIERFLSLAAEDNLQVAQPTTPAQLFHLLRRQVLRRWRKPLVVMTPKSLLRHPSVTSGLDALADGRFERVVRDPSAGPGTRRVLLCSGKVAYDLERARTERGRGDVAIVRVEQLYPLADATLEAALAAVPAGIEARWVQDEPANMGAAPYLKARFGCGLPGGRPFSVASRPASASPATGSASSHQREQKDLLDRAFEGL